MYVCWECWRAEMKFKRAFYFFKCLLRFFRRIFQHETNVETFSTNFQRKRSEG